MSNDQPRKTRTRYEVDGQPRFLTFSCRHRLPLFADESVADVFANDLQSSRDRLSFELRAWVVMPEHVHLIVIPSEEGSVSQILRAVKAPIAIRTAAMWKQSDLPFAKLREPSGRSRFWQPGGGYDRNIRSESDLREKIDYIHANPVRRGLVTSPMDWRWSSASELMV